MSPDLRNRLLAIKRMAEQDIGNPAEQDNAARMLKNLCEKHGVSEEEVAALEEGGGRIFTGQVQAQEPDGSVVTLEGEFEDLGAGRVRVIRARVVSVRRPAVTVIHIGMGGGFGWHPAGSSTGDSSSSSTIWWG